MSLSGKLEELLNEREFKYDIRDENVFRLYLRTKSNKKIKVIAFTEDKMNTIRLVTMFPSLERNQDDYFNLLREINEYNFKIVYGTIFTIDIEDKHALGFSHSISASKGNDSFISSEELDNVFSYITYLYDDVLETFSGDIDGS